MPNVAPIDPRRTLSPGLDRLIASVDAVRNVDPAFPVGWLAAILHVARNEDRKGGLSIRDLSDLMDTSYSTVAEAVKKMAAPGRRFSEAADLLKYERDPLDDRRKLLRLTARGKALVRKLELINTSTGERRG